jgi:cation diffusion facilitator family transporter
MKNEAKVKQNVALSSVFASLLLTLLKLIVGILTGSISIISEAAHSALDLGAASITYYAVRESSKPADREHHYGHGKVESFSALAETALLFITSGWIIYEAVQRLLSRSVKIDVTWYAFAVMFTSIIVDFSRSRALERVAKATNSQALEADALHFKTDIWSSSVVIAGLGFVMLGIKGADAIAALGVAMFVIYAGIRLGRRTIDVLVDTAPAGLSDTVREIVKKVAGVERVKRVRIRAAGTSLFVDTTVAVSYEMALTKAHEVTDKIEKAIEREIPNSDVIVHVEPHRDKK